MQISTEEMRAGSHDDKIVYICDYHQPDFSKKPLRKVPPIKCIIVSNDKLPKGKNIYYSQSHFISFSKSGKLSKQIISPVDNTGYRSRIGNELYIFETKDECIEKWNQLITEHLKDLNEYVIRYMNGLKYDIKKLSSLKINTD